MSIATAERHPQDTANKDLVIDRLQQDIRALKQDKEESVACLNRNIQAIKLKLAAESHKKGQAFKMVAAGKAREENSRLAEQRHAAEITRLHVLHTESQAQIEALEQQIKSDQADHFRKQAEAEGNLARERGNAGQLVLVLSALAESDPKIKVLQDSLPGSWGGPTRPR